MLLVSVLSAAEGSTGRVRYALNQVRRVAIQHHARSPSNLRDVTPVQALRAVRPTPPRSEVASPVAPVAKSRAKGKAKAKARAAASESAGSALEVGPFAMQPRGTVANYLPPTLPRRSVRAEGTAVAAAAAPVITRRSRRGPAVGKQTSPGLALPVTAVAASSVLILILISLRSASCRGGVDDNRSCGPHCSSDRYNSRGVFRRSL